MIEWGGMTNKTTPLLDRTSVIANFNRAADSYDRYAILQREIVDRLLDRLDLVDIQPEVILDIGARTGYTTQRLCQRYPQAQIIAMDWAEKLLQQAKNTAPGTLTICAEPEQLPLSAQSADLIIAHLVWHWSNDGPRCLQEWRRLLKPGGLLLLTTCGPDTLSELRASFAAVDEAPHVHLFLDMHDIGDALMAARFSEPVLQAEHLTLTYASLAKLWQDLRNTGVVNALASRRRGLTGSYRWQRMVAEYEKFASVENGWPMTVEVVYALAWADDLPSSHPNESGEIVVPIDQVRRKIYG